MTLTPGASIDATTLSEICEPLFLFACRLNRAARAEDMPLDVSAVRAEAERVFRTMAEMAVQASLEDQYEKVRPALLFFLDMTIASSSHPWKEQWSLMSREEGWAAPGQDFFRLLEETEADRSPAANERLQIFFTCLALGFEGAYHDRPEDLKPIFNRVRSRVEGVAGIDPRKPLCPEAYQGIFRSVQPFDGGRLLRRTVMFTGLSLAALLMINLVVYSLMTREVSNYIDSYLEPSPSAIPVQSPTAVQARAATTSERLQ